MKFNKSPKRLFIVDGVGALLSAFLLGIVLVYFESFFGIPKNVLYILASFPILFAILDFFFLFQNRTKVGRNLKLIALLNIFYCFLSIGLAVMHIDAISRFGWASISVEILIVLALAAVEYKVGQKGHWKS